MVRLIFLISEKINISKAYVIRKKEGINDARAAVKRIVEFTPPINERKVIVIKAIARESRSAIIRGLSDMLRSVEIQK